MTDSKYEPRAAGPRLITYFIVFLKIFDAAEKVSLSLFEAAAVDLAALVEAGSINPDVIDIHSAEIMVCKCAVAADFYAVAVVKPADLVLIFAARLGAKCKAACPQTGNGLV